MNKIERTTFRFGSVACILLCFASNSLWATEQVIPAHPRANLELSDESEQDEPINFILSSAQRIRHEVTFKHSVKVFGPVSSNTYRMPSDLKRSEVTDWFKEQITMLEGNIEFDCEQRSCGRATIWASDIFEQRVLSASDTNQNYLAVSIDRDEVQHLVMIYVVERGNHRVYAQVVEIVPNERITFDLPIDVSSELLRFGTVRLANVKPDSQGVLSSEALAELENLAQTELAKFVDEEIYVVCHVHGPHSTDELIEYSKDCAEQVVESFAEAGLSVIPFGTGPLSPLDQTAVSRVELVIPRLLRQQVD